MESVPVYKVRSVIKLIYTDSKRDPYINAVYELSRLSVERIM